MIARAEGSSSAWSVPRRLFDGLLGAIALLTIVPVRSSSETSLASSAGWLVLVGTALGALAGGVRFGASRVLGAAPATVLAMILLVLLSGGLHQDGLADTADGLGARGGRERRLQAMRDSATGSYGTLALLAWALLLFSTVSSLDAGHALAALIAAGALGRWAALLHARMTTAARSDGLGKALEPGFVAVGAGTLTAVAVALLACGLNAGGAALGTGLLCAALSSGLARRSLGGRTGDTLGATVAVTEVAVCTVLLLSWHALGHQM